MKKIEERAAEIFADRFCTRCPKILYTTCDRKLPGCCRIPEVRCMHEVIKNTIVSERAELTRWNEPNDIPDNDTPVIICTSPGIYYIAAYDKQFNYWFTGNGSFYRHEIIGWREIHE